MFQCLGCHPSFKYLIHSWNVESTYSISLIHGQPNKKLYYFSLSMNCKYEWFILEPTTISNIMLPKVLQNLLLNDHKMSVGSWRCEKGRLSLLNVVEDTTFMVDLLYTKTILKDFLSTLSYYVQWRILYFRFITFWILCW